MLGKTKARNCNCAAEGTWKILDEEFKRRGSQIDSMQREIYGYKRLTDSLEAEVAKYRTSPIEHSFWQAHSVRAEKERDEALADQAAMAKELKAALDKYEDAEDFIGMIASTNGSGSGYRIAAQRFMEGRG